MIFDIVFRIHTKSHSYQTRELRNLPAGRMQGDPWFLHGEIFCVMSRALQSRTAKQ